jgi:CheY-like chemotaxis protein
MSESLSVLVVDDHPSMATGLADILEFKGFEVFVAYSGAEALEILRNHPFDILLTDVIMPDMNGVELFWESKKSYPYLTTFLMTAYAAEDIIQQSMAKGIQATLTKPVDIDSLLSLFSTIQRRITNAAI